MSMPGKVLKLIGGGKVRLYSKREIMEIWGGLDKLDELTCPDCRDDLSISEYEDLLHCTNLNCNNDDHYENPEEEEQDA